MGAKIPGYKKDPASDPFRGNLSLSFFSVGLFQHQIDFYFLLLWGPFYNILLQKHHLNKDISFTGSFEI